MNDHKTTLLKTWEEMPNYFVTSSSNDIGKDDLLEYIDQLNRNMESEKISS
jgi:GTP-binding protein